MKKIFKKGSRVLESYFTTTIQFGNYPPERLVVVRNELDGRFYWRHYAGTDVFGTCYGSDGLSYPTMFACCTAMFRSLSNSF